MKWTSFWPESASSVSSPVDTLMGFMIALTIFFAVAIAGVILYFSIRYRHDSPVDRTRAAEGSHLWLEITWTVIPLAIVMVIFFWSSGLFFHMKRAPEDALPVYVTAKQWMWKTWHPDGGRDINALHVPAGRPVKLTMISDDVIHSFYVPAFRVKQDVLPGRYTTLWFEPTRPGTYHLFCAEYCGTSHSEMIGRVVVLPPEAFEIWRASGAAQGSLASTGERLFSRFGCLSCHDRGRGETAPPLHGLFNRPVSLVGRTTRVADENYLREAILNPAATIVEGYGNTMPAYQGQIDEQGVIELIEYIKSLKDHAR